MVSRAGAWLKRVVLSLLIIHVCVVGGINQSECHLPFTLLAHWRIAIIVVDMPGSKVECFSADKNR